MRISNEKLAEVVEDARLKDAPTLYAICTDLQDARSQLDAAQAENARLREALEEIRDKTPKNTTIQAVQDTHHMYKHMARKALTQTPQEEAR